MRRALLLASTAVVALAAVGWAAPQPASTLAPVVPVKRRAADRRDAIKKVEADLGVLLVDAKVSAAAAAVKTYKSYTDKQFIDRAPREVDVEMLVLQVVKDETIPRDVREEAASAVFNDQTQRVDADIDPNGKGMRRPRAQFCKKVLLPLLVSRGPNEDENVFKRTQANAMLLGLWPGIATQKEPEIIGCRPTSLTSCTQAKAAWERWLAR
jgi:hypothetical protein